MSLHERAEAVYESACRKVNGKDNSAVFAGTYPGTFVNFFSDPQPLPDELSEVPAFDPDLLPEAFRGWVSDTAERAQLPMDFPAVGVMVAAGSTIGRQIGIRPKRYDDWTELANLWGGIIGRPGVMKSPALEAAMNPLNRLVAQALETHKKELADYELRVKMAKIRAKANESEALKRIKKNPNADITGLCSSGEEEEEPPVCRRYLVTDCTIEALIEVLRQNPNGVLAFRDELVGLLRQLDREDQAEARSFFLTAWNGKNGWVSDRIGRGLNLQVEACCVGVLGGIQPGALSTYLRQAVRGGVGDDGLLQRFGMLVWPDISGTWVNVDRWPDTAAKNKAFEVFKRLSCIPWVQGRNVDTDDSGRPIGIPYLRFSPTAQGRFDAWRETLELRLRNGHEHPAFESHLSKYRKLVPSIALLCHLVDIGSGDVSLTSLLRAIAWAEYLEAHARRIYGSVIRYDMTSARALLRRLKDVQNTFSLKDIYDKGWTSLGTREEAQAAVDVLIEYGWLGMTEIRTGERGRPKTTYHVNSLARATP